MRTPQRILTVAAILGVGACATGEVPESPYAEVARIVGAGFTTPAAGGELGAFADSAKLARDELPFGFERHASGLVEGSHGDTTYRYFVVCIDATGFAVDPCGSSTERARVLASWSGPVVTADHEGTLRRGGYWTITDPWRSTAMVAGDTWFDFDAGSYRIEDDRDVLLVMQMDSGVVTAGGMNARITLHDGTGAPAQNIHGDIALTTSTATITLDGVYTTDVDVRPIVIE